MLIVELSPSQVILSSTPFKNHFWKVITGGGKETIFKFQGMYMGKKDVPDEVVSSSSG